MKISCQSCAAKYTIADEKVLGKVIKIKCKKCGATIVVNGNDPTFAAGEAASASGGYDAGGDAGGGTDEWTVSVTDDDQRTMSTDDVIAAYQRGELAQDTYLWREGMSGWLPLSGVPEFASVLGAQDPAGEDDPGATAVFTQSPLQNGGDHGGAAAYAAPAPAPAPMAAAAPLPSAATAARKPRTAKVDLFGGGGNGGGGAGVDAHGLPNAMGERNETSVLFSLSALQAAEASAARPHVSPARTNPGMNNDRVDDILGLGGGGIAPMLAPPPLMAPIIEPPPPPPPPVSVAPPPASYGPGAMGMYPNQYQQQKKGPPVALLAGGGVAALALVGGLAFFLGRGATDDPPKSETPTTAAAAKDEPKAEAKDEPKTDTPKTPDTAAPTPDTTADPGATADPKNATTPPAGGVAPSTGAGKFDPLAAKKAAEDKKAEEKKAADEKKAAAEEKKSDTKEPPSTSGAPFDRGAASAALGGAAGSAKSCGKPGGPTGSGKVQVTFAPSGKATQATVGAPFAGTPVGSCIAGIFRGARVPAFQGEPMTVSKTVSIK